MVDDAVGSGSAARVERSNFDTGLEIAVGAAAATTPSQAGQPAPLVRGHQRKAANPPWVANDDRRAEQWEDVEEARATRVRRTGKPSASASGTRSSSSQQHQHQRLADPRPAPRKTPSTSSARSSFGSTGPASLRTAAEAAGGGVGSCGRASNGHYFKSSAAARESPQASRHTGSGVDLGDSPAARRTVRHRHSSLLGRADTLSQLSTPSLVSIFSSLTHSSSGSNSTVTQKSYDRSHGIKKRKHSSRHHSSSKRSESQGSAKLGDRAPRRRRRSSQPPTAAHQSAEPGPSISQCQQTSCPPAVDCAFATNARKPSAVARDRVNSDSGISVRDSSPEGTGRAAGRMDGMAAALPWDPQQDDEEEEDRQRQLAINRLYQELAARDSQAALESVVGDDDHGLQKLMAQEEQLRQHMLRSPPTHHHARDEPHYAHNGDASSGGPTVFPYYYYSDSSSQPQPGQPGPYWGHHPDPPPPPAPHVPVHDPGFHHAAAQQQPYGQFPPAPPSPRGRGGGGGVGSGVGTQLQPGDGPPDLAEMTITGYEKLASSLAATPTSPSHDDGQKSGADGRTRAIRPLYRRFEYLNHRILLHLQDELAEYEEELRELDECLARHQQQAIVAGGVEAGIPMPPASRRLESRYGSEVHARRTLVLGNIYLKLGQYNTAMTSFAKMLSDLEPAQADDVSAYESWIREHAPIAERETRFLTRQPDLMAFGQRQRRRQDRHPGSLGDQQQRQQGMEETLQTALLALLVFLVLPLIAFPQIPNVGGRLFILTIIGAAEVAVVVSSTRFLCLMSGTEWRICGIAYFALMAVIAGVV